MKHAEQHGPALCDEKAHHTHHQNGSFLHASEKRACQWRAGEQTGEQRESHELCLWAGEMPEKRVGMKRQGVVGPQGDEKQQRADEQDPERAVAKCFENPAQHARPEPATAF